MNRISTPAAYPLADRGDRAPLRARAGRRIDPAAKYRPFKPIQLPGRRWPSRSIQEAPIWCSVDLRDGNQALIEPMDVERKLRMFETLVAIGFKEIEIGFPSASQIEFDLTRLLIERNLIPTDVTIQVLTQAREDLIKRTFESIRGAHRATVHLYNSTSPVQRNVVFGRDRGGIIDMAMAGTKLVREFAERSAETQVVFEYSPESFSATELDFALEICEAVMDVWRPTPEERLVLNLPATVEMASPNVFADQIEWFSSRMRGRDSVVLSVHPHNDRGTAVAAAELALMAGADRIEGTLFGNGERTGNVDIVTLALNLWTQGIDPGLDFSDINHLVRVAEHCNRLPVHPRHPYAGDLVFTAFSGSHQDAIRKGFEARRVSGSLLWEVPYLPIDPIDLGRTYEAVIRINSQSGKGGIAFVMEEEFGYRLPRRLQIEFRQVVQRIADSTGEELTHKHIIEAFEAEYLATEQRFELINQRLVSEQTGANGGDMVTLEATVSDGGRPVRISGVGNGPLDAFVDALQRCVGVELRVSDYREHALGAGADASAVAYIEVQINSGASFFGVGRDPNLMTASLRAVLSALNRIEQAYGRSSEGADNPRARAQACRMQLVTCGPLEPAPAEPQRGAEAARA